MIKTPQNVKLLTNVQVVRLKKGNQKFEIACYPNKIVDWRNKRETNLNEVLQIDKIFVDVQKGEFAQKKAMKEPFGKMSEEEIIVEILNKGEFQLSDKERDTQLENLRLDIANIIVKMAINANDGN
jgi:ribosome maturation protein SDO1